MESVAGAAGVGFPEKHRACRSPVVTPRSVSVSTGTTLIAVHARDATAIGSAPVALTTASSAAQALARDAASISESGESARVHFVQFPKMTFGTCRAPAGRVTYRSMEPGTSHGS
jgi:hypothetical protein